MGTGIDKPPYYHTLTSYLKGKEEGLTLEESDPVRALDWANKIRHTICSFNDYRMEWTSYYVANAKDPVAEFVMEEVLGPSENERT